MRKFIFLTIFGVAMGFLEAAVCAYLREIGLEIFTNRLVSIEIGREISTIVMLVMVAIVAGKNFLQRFAYFLYSFAVWDIFYYVGLKVFLDWPSSLLTWDLLFLIPFPWRAPVLVPLICSLTMAPVALFLVYLQEKDGSLKINYPEWILLILGAFLIFFSCVLDSFWAIIREGLLFTPSGWTSKIILQSFSDSYNWWIFISGVILMWGTVIFFKKRVS